MYKVEWKGGGYISLKCSTNKVQLIITIIAFAIPGILFGLTTNALGQGDTTPPTLSNFVIDTPVINTTSGPDTVRTTSKCTG